MKGSCARCPHCKSTDLSANRANETIQCDQCLHILEERVSQTRETKVQFEREVPLCVADLPHDVLSKHKFEEIVDDPFLQSGFITAFSQTTLQEFTVFTCTARTYAGHLADLERILTDFGPERAAQGGENEEEGERQPEEAVAAPASAPPPSLDPRVAYASQIVMAENPGGILWNHRQVELRNILVAYFQILELCDKLSIGRDICDEAVRMFRKCAETTSLRNKNVEALATAALVIALREAQQPRTLQEVSMSSGILQKDIGKGIKHVTAALQVDPAVNSNSISVHMPRFCSALALDEETEQLATKIGETVMTKNYCNRRNPVSISAAAIYLACNLQDQKKTQTEICKATGLTEVTLRKVHKELLMHHKELLPSNYTPKVPLDKAFPSSLLGASVKLGGKAPAGWDAASGEAGPPPLPAGFPWNIPPPPVAPDGWANMPRPNIPGMPPMPPGMWPQMMAAMMQMAAKSTKEGDGDQGAAAAPPTAQALAEAMDTAAQGEMAKAAAAASSSLPTMPTMPAVPLARGSSPRVMQPRCRAALLDC